jgi:RNA polymerase sigma factor (sigma-70 family)
MNTNRSPVTRYLRRVLAVPSALGLTDAQLLERFVIDRDEAAFEALMCRHGPKVLGVCRRILHHEQDTEDAFQATFLLLVRKAGSIAKGESVGSWLYCAAYRVALRAKKLAARRSVHQRRLADVPAAHYTPDLVWRDLRPVLDEEVSRLPEKYRVPFILCYFDGKTNEEAARELDCPKGTVLSRLAWARQRLRTRLARRGLALSAGMLGAGLWPKTVSAVVSETLLDTTLKAAMLVAGGQATAGLLSGQAALLCKGVLQTMFWTKVKIATGCVFVVGALGITGSVVTRPMLEAELTASQPARRAESIQIGEPRKEPDVRAEAASATSEPAEATAFAMEFRDAPWGNVLLWLSSVTGKPVGATANANPTGTLTFIPPKVNGTPKRYTIVEIIHIFNRELLKQEMILVDRPETFCLEPIVSSAGRPILKTYPVPDGNAEAVAKWLADLYKTRSIRISAVGANSIMVYANPSHQLAIAEQIRLQTYRADKPHRGQRTENGPEGNSVQVKLNQILDRLNKIEKRLDSLERFGRSRPPSPGPEDTKK